MSWINNIRNIIGHPQQSAIAIGHAVQRKLGLNNQSSQSDENTYQSRVTGGATSTPFLFGRDDSAVKDLSNSYLSRITPQSKNIQTILGNQFVQEVSNNTIRPARYFKQAGADTLLGDNRVPLRNIRYFMCVKDGKLKIGKLSDFNDDDVVIPVWNKTEPVYSFDDGIGVDSVYAARRNYDRLNNEYESLSDESSPNQAKLDSIGADIWRNQQYMDRTVVPIYHGANGDVPIPDNGQKSLLVSPNGNAMFLNSSKAGYFNAEQSGAINDFLKRNKYAYPIMLDNGRYELYTTRQNNESDEDLYNRYVSEDFWRVPEDMYIFGEVDNN